MIEPTPNSKEVDAAPPNDVQEANAIPESVGTTKTQPEEQEPSPFSKPCSLCQRRRDVLIRCQIDETKKWNFICPGKCWNSVTGGRTFATEHHPHYVYGGTWKNKHAYVSGKIKGKAKEQNKNHWNGTPGPHRAHGSRTKKLSKKDLGQSRFGIGADDGASDIEVSDQSGFSEEEFEYNENDGKDDAVATESTTDNKIGTAVI